ncbi:uracil phosphoribosyltransferase [marine bacterium AO1-C]|nr:uracil phosphoribosyltransferase [marine bacterium AO1-C]
MFVFTQKHSIANQFIAELRDQNIQQDSFRFRTNMERLGALFAYEISKELPYQEISVTTPLGKATTHVLAQQPVLATILRASLPLYQGFLSVFDKAESAFIGAYRGPHKEDNSFDIVQGYTATPNLQGRILILIDPMLATGKSMVSTYQQLLKYGQPAQIHMVSIIASKAGVDYVKSSLPEAQLWMGDIDEEMNHKSYIIPGLGDAGDLAFGEKL